MAEIQSQKRSSKKAKRFGRSTRVDLTPMVDLGFLLITFFVITTSLREPKAAELIMPKDTLITTLIKESVALTLILGENDLVHYYNGSIDTATILSTHFGYIRNVIITKLRYVGQKTGDPKETILIIKAHANSSYKNLVDILDEVMINDIRHYYLSEITEKKIIDYLN